MRDPVEEALRQVRSMQSRMLEKQRFKGYSGRARAMGGCICLALSLASGHLAANTPQTTLWLWLTTALLAGALNFGALVYWFLTDPEVERDWRRLQPLGAVLPALIAGTILTYALAKGGHYGLLYGCWMLFYGLANFASRTVLPRAIQWTGGFYILAGAVFLLSNPASFTAPLSAAVVFFIGEWLAGLILHFDEKPETNLLAFFGLPTRNHE